MDYDDILHLPCPASTHPRMPVADRAAQFSPFAAVKGHDAVRGEVEHELGKSFPVEKPLKKLSTSLQ